MKLRRIFTGMLSAVMLCGCFSSVAFADEKTKIFIVGDSTACIYGSDDNYAAPRAGWGMYLQQYIDDGKAEVVDLAISGRSSKSFTVEDEYKTLLNDMDKGDYLIIQFGHNDAKKTKPEDLANRYTDPNGDKDTDGSFKNSLYKNYVKVAEEKGANPILLTPIVRRSFDEQGKVEDTHGIYDDDVRELATELQVPLVDANKITEAMYNELGFDGTAMYHAIYKDTEKGNKGHDDTHLNHFGADKVACAIAGELEKVNGIGNFVTFKNSTPNSVTRAEFTYEIVRLIGKDYAGKAESCFPDVDVLDIDTTAISTAKKLGIVNGDDKGNFNPNKAISFQEMCTITARALNVAGVELNKDTAVLNKLGKLDELKPYASESVAALMNLWGDVIPNYANPREIMDKGSIYTLYSLVYDEVNDADENATPQSIDEVEKVE